MGTKRIVSKEISEEKKQKARQTCERLAKARWTIFIIEIVLFVIAIILMAIFSICLSLWGVALDIIVFFIYLSLAGVLLAPIIILSIVIFMVGKRSGVRVRRKEMNYRSLESLERIERLCEETDVALNKKPKERRFLSVIVGFVIIIVVLLVMMLIAYILLINLGTVGLSAVGISTALAAIGGSMVGGIFVIALIIAVPPIIVGVIFFSLRELKFKTEKDALYKEALRKQEAVVRALKEEVDADSERIEYLNELNILLKRTIKELNEDKGNSEQA